MRYFNQFAHVSSRTTAQTAQGEGGSDEDGPTADEFGGRNDLVDGIASHGLADGEVDRFADFVEQLTVFRFVDGVQVRTDELHAKTFQGAVVGKFAGDVEGGLSTHAGQKRTRALLFQNLGDGGRQQRFNVDDVGHFGVVLDGGRVGIDENDLVAVLTKGTDGLRA